MDSFHRAIDCPMFASGPKREVVPIVLPRWFLSEDFKDQEAGP